jgi:serine protease Do
VTLRQAFLVSVCLSLATAGSVSGDEFDATPAEREKMYADLAHEAVALERALGVVKRVVKTVAPTVVHIEASKTRQLQLGYGTRAVEEAGSGVIISLKDHFYVITNRHVIKSSDAEHIRIKLADSRVVHPTQIWSDMGTDVAVMEINEPRIIPAKLGDSSKLEIGDFVIAVGSPFGLSHSVTYGIISAKGRRDLELGDDGVRFQDFMQTDAAINPGNSGGPLMNLRGELVGINTAIASSSGGNEGIGFTIPIDMAMIVARQLINTGTVVRAFLGVNLDSKFGPTIATRLGLRRTIGARITGVTDSSPAAEAKLQIDDVILKFGEIPVENDSHLVNLVGLTEVGKEVSVLVFRDKKPLTLMVTVGDRSKYEPPTP